MSYFRGLSTIITPITGNIFSLDRELDSDNRENIKCCIKLPRLAEILNGGRCTTALWRNPVGAGKPLFHLGVDRRTPLGQRPVPQPTGRTHDRNRTAA
jgi:hypothetical protein